MVNRSLWTPLKELPKRKGHSMTLCRCGGCGKEKPVRTQALRSGAALMCLECHRKRSRPAKLYRTKLVVPYPRREVA